MKVVSEEDLEEAKGRRHYYDGKLTPTSARLPTHKAFPHDGPLGGPVQDHHMLDLQPKSIRLMCGSEPHFSPVLRYSPLRRHGLQVALKL